MNKMETAYELLLEAVHDDSKVNYPIIKVRAILFEVTDGLKSALDIMETKGNSVDKIRRHVKNWWTRFLGSNAFDKTWLEAVATFHENEAKSVRRYIEFMHAAGA